MKPCQLCGACSWGSVNGFVNDQACAPQTYLIGKELSLFRCCDGCGSFAVLASVEDSPSLEAARLMIEPSPGGPFDQALQQMQQVLVASMPKPQGRAERMICALLSARGVTMDASDLVEFVRCLEAELDGPRAPKGASLFGKSSLYRFQMQFTDRVALETWLRAGLHDTDCPTPLEKELASQFADWVEERMP